PQLLMCSCLFFFFQAEDGIRDGHVTGVQTCALPISDLPAALAIAAASFAFWSWSRAPSPRRALWVALALGAAVCTRLTAWLLVRSEERRVGKECRSGLAADH